MNDPVRHTFEHLLGLPADFLTKQGDWALHYNPAWPGQSFIGAPVWNIALIIAVALLVSYVYTHDGRSKKLRVGLGVLRSLLFALVIFLLNRPTLTVGQSQTEPSVLAVMIDDSRSMRVPDVGSDAAPQSRLSAVQSLLTRNQGAVLRELSHHHNLRLYKFDRDATPIAGVEPPPAINDQNTAAVPLSDSEQQQHRLIAQLTLPGSLLYFLALLSFLTGMAIGSGSLRRWGIVFAAAGTVAQLVGMIIRWSVLSKETGVGGARHSEFASIIFSHWFGTIAVVALVGVVAILLLEMWRGRGLFGAGAGLIGCVVLMVMFAAPYLATTDPRSVVRVASAADIAPAMTAVSQLEPTGNSTQVLPSILTAMQDLQGQHVAGVVLLTDGRDTPAHNIAEGLDALKNYGVKVYPIAVGSDQSPKNIEVQNMEVG